MDRGNIFSARRKAGPAPLEKWLRGVMAVTAVTPQTGTPSTGLGPRAAAKHRQTQTDTDTHPRTS